MKFWDSSAIVPLVVEEPTSAACRRLLRTDRTQIVWCLTRTEVISALRRRHRERALTTEEVTRAEARLERLAARWSEVIALDPTRELAERLLRAHGIRAADALQLAAALVAVNERPRQRGFISQDEALLAAAEREGFDALRPAD